MTQIAIGEPRDGLFVLVGVDPCEVVAVRQDAPDVPVGQWYPLTGGASEPMSFKQLLGSGAPEAAVPLYRMEQAVQDGVLPVLRIAYERYAVAIIAAEEPELRRDYTRMACAVRAVLGDLCAHFGVPMPQLPLPGARLSDPEATQEIPTATEGPRGEGPAVAEQPTEVLPAVRVARESAATRVASAVGRAWRAAPSGLVLVVSVRLAVARARRGVAVLARPVVRPWLAVYRAAKVAMEPERPGRHRKGARELETALRQVRQAALAEKRVTG